MKVSTQQNTGRLAEEGPGEECDRDGVEKGNGRDKAEVEVVVVGGGGLHRGQEGVCISGR